MEPTRKDGDILINGQKEQDPELTKPAGKSTVLPLSLGTGEYFALGDNRGRFFGSRDRNFGTVTKEKFFKSCFVLLAATDIERWEEFI